MKTLLLAAFLSAASVSTAGALDAAHAPALARRNACLACHAPNKKRIGPSYREVAAKYKNDQTALAELVKKVKKVSVGVWGTLPMPAYPELSDTDAQVILEWVLAGAPLKH
jgi:cytochrome c